MSKYYLGRFIDCGLQCYCKDGSWRLYVECENDWSQVFVGDSKEAYDLLFELQGGEPVPNRIVVRNNSLQRDVYFKITWEENWAVSGKVLAVSHYHACRLFGLEPRESGGEVQVVHYSDLYRYRQDLESVVEGMTCLQ